MWFKSPVTCFYFSVLCPTSLKKKKIAYNLLILKIPLSKALICMEVLTSAVCSTFLPSLTVNNCTATFLLHNSSLDHVSQLAPNASINLLIQRLPPLIR